MTKSESDNKIPRGVDLSSLDYQISMLLRRDDLSEGDLPVPMPEARRVLIITCSSSGDPCLAQRLLDNVARDESGTLKIVPISDKDAESKQFQEGDFDLVLIEISSARTLWMKTFTLVSERMPDTPVAILATFQDRNLAIKAFNYGVVDFISCEDGDSSSLVNAVLLCVERCKASQLKRASMKLEKQAIRDAFEHCPVVMLRIDSDFILRDCNHHFVSLTRSDVASLKGKSVFDLAPDMDLECVRSVIESGEPCKIRIHLRELGGREIDEYWDLFSWPVYRTLGARPEAIIAGLDVTKEVILEAERDEFIAAMAHDIRNPISGQQMVLSKLVDRVSDEQALRYLKVLRESNENVLKLLDTLMNSYSLESQSCAPEETVDLVEVLQGQLGLVAEVAALSGKSVEVEIEDGSKRVFGDEWSLVRIVSNLLSNAVKYSPDQTVIRLKVSSSSDRVCCSISNRIVSKQSFEERLFERFSGSSSNRPHSSGYGLFLTRKLLKLMGGTIEYSRQEDLVTFSIYMPVSEE